MGEVIQLRDFQRREERDAGECERSVYAGHPGQINVYDTSPCEMPPVQPSFTAPESDPA